MNEFSNRIKLTLNGSGKSLKLSCHYTDVLYRFANKHALYKNMDVTVKDLVEKQKNYYEYVSLIGKF